MPPKGRAKPTKIVPKDLCIYLAEVDENGLVPEETIGLVRQCVIDKIFADNSDHIAICRSDMTSSIKFETASWDALRSVENKFREWKKLSGSQKSNPIGTLQDICQIIISQAEEDSYETLKILFFGNLKLQIVTDDEVLELASTLKENNIVVSFIVPDMVEDMDDQQAKNLRTLRKILNNEELEEFTCVVTRKQAKNQIMNTLSKPTKRSMPWNVEMEIGPDISISVSGYVCTRKNKIGEMKKAILSDTKDVPSYNSGATTSSNQGALVPVSDSNSRQRPESKTVAVEIAKNVTEKEVVWKEKNGNVVEEADVGKGYFYGDKLVPFNELESEDLYRSGPKCLKVLVFCPRTNIQPIYQQGDGTTLFFARRDDKVAEAKLDALVRAMHAANRVAVVRKVYLKDKRVNLGILSPDLERRCLVFCEVCFADDLSVPHFPVLFKQEESNSEEDEGGITNKEQLIDNLILNMSLDTFTPSDGPVDPAAFNLRNSVASRILDKSGGEIKAKGEDTMDVFFANVVTTDLLLSLQDAFPLKVKKEDAERPSGANIFKRQLDEKDDFGEEKKQKMIEPKDEGSNKELVTDVEKKEVDYDDLLDEL